MHLDKALDILEVFLQHRSELGIADLARISKMNVSTAHRIASILVERGYLTQPKKGGKYFLGPSLLEFAPVVLGGLTIRDIARDFLIQLNREVNESVNMAVLDGNQVLIIDFFPSSKGLSYINKIGERLPLHNTGLGKALLAHVGEKELDEYLKNNRLPAYTENTITDPALLREELDTIRRAGISIDNEENELGGKCIAAPIKNSSGNVLAAFSISVPSTRLDDKRIESLKHRIETAGKQISRAIGYGGI